MGDAVEDRRKAAELPDGDVIRILLEQHAQIRDLFADIAGSHGEVKKARFDRLRALLAVHETAEEIVLRPTSARAAGETVTDARNAEEAKANAVLKQLESMDVDDPAFDRELAAFRRDVEAHAEAEEGEEFPAVLASCDPALRADLGDRLQAIQVFAPTHPHPSTAGNPVAQSLTGPFVAMVDRVRDALAR